jgi:hypothetical protein
MQTIKVTARFRGDDGSLGFVKGNKYVLELSHEPGKNTIVKCEGHPVAEYESAYSFIVNWDLVMS